MRRVLYLLEHVVAVWCDIPGLVLTELTLKSKHAVWASHSLPHKSTLRKDKEEVRGQKSAS